MLKPPMLTYANQRGAGLVELMIALVLGMMVVGSALGLYANTFGSNGSYLQVARLNNDLRAVMTIIAKDLRRAGYSSTAAAGTANPFEAITITGGTQITFSYDYDSNGSVSANESFGYRLNNGAIQVTVNGGTNWENISDPDKITITEFEITDSSPAAVSMGTTTVVNVQTRRYTILIKGTITYNGTTFTRVLQEDVRIRNEIVT